MKEKEKQYMDDPTESAKFQMVGQSEKKFEGNARANRECTWQSQVEKYDCNAQPRNC